MDSQIWPSLHLDASWGFAIAERAGIVWVLVVKHAIIASDWALHARSLLLLVDVLLMQGQADLADGLALALAASTILHRPELVLQLEIIWIRVVVVDVGGIRSVLHVPSQILPLHFFFRWCSGNLLARDEALSMFFELGLIIDQLAFDLHGRLRLILELIMLGHVLVLVWAHAVGRRPQDLWPASQF